MRSVFSGAELLEARNRDVAILLLSEELDELVALSDRLVVMAEGKIVDSAPINEIDRQLIGETNGQPLMNRAVVCKSTCDCITASPLLPGSWTHNLFPGRFHLR